MVSSVDELLSGAQYSGPAIDQFDEVKIGLPQDIEMMGVERERWMRDISELPPHVWNMRVR